MENQQHTFDVPDSPKRNKSYMDFKDQKNLTLKNIPKQSEDSHDMEIDVVCHRKTTASKKKELGSF